MRTISTPTLAPFFLLAFTAGTQAQQTQPGMPVTTVPRLVRVSNSFLPANGLPAAAVESVTLSVYNAEHEGAPLWQETQNVNVDAQGHYTVLLGATLNDGMPLELFSSTEPRWLGVQFNRPAETEQPRVQLVSVPYALKASDAETLGGLPPSAYLRTPAATAQTANGGSGSTTVSLESKPKAITGTPTANSVVKFTDTAGDIGNSIITDTGSLAVAGQAAIGSGHAPQTYGFDLYVNGTNPTALIDAYGNPGTASLFLQGRSTSASNHRLSVNSAGLFSITPSSTGTPAFAISQSGILSLGTTTPWSGAKFQVHSGTNQNLALSGPLSLSNGVTLHSLNDAINANEGLEFRGSPIVLAVGNVGIGTTTPGSTLEVAGNLTVSGSGHALIFPDGTQQSTAGPTGTFGSNSINFFTEGGAGTTCTLGSILLNASTLYTGNYLPADGRLLSIQNNTALFSLLGTNYGGNGTSTFGLPDLRKAAPNNTQYLICVSGVFP